MQPHQKYFRYKNRMAASPLSCVVGINLINFPVLVAGYLRGDGSVDNRGAEGDLELHLPRPLRVDVLHHGGQHQGGHLGGPTDEDGPHHQGEPQVPRHVHQGTHHRNIFFKI